MKKNLILSLIFAFFTDNLFGAMHFSTTHIPKGELADQVIQLRQDVSQLTQFILSDEKDCAVLIQEASAHLPDSLIIYINRICSNYVNREKLQELFLGRPESRQYSRWLMRRAEMMKAMILRWKEHLSEQNKKTLRRDTSQKKKYCMALSHLDSLIEAFRIDAGWHINPPRGTTPNAVIS